MPFCNPLRYHARCKRLLDNPKLVPRRPPPPPFTADPHLDLLGKIALKRPLTSLIRRLVHLRRWPFPLHNPVSCSQPRRGRCSSAHAYVRAANHAVQLSPLDHRLFLFHNIMAWANFAAGSDAEAAKWARASHSASPRFTANVRILIASLAAIGADKEARAAAEALMSLEPDFTLSRYERTLLPDQDPGIRARLLTCLRSAGLPP